MIIFRYLTREVIQSMLAISGVLLLIIVSGRFIKYLAQAATGALNADFLFSIMGYRLPGFLELILPLGLFVGIMLSYGRLYLESEMTVLETCGMSQGQLLRMTMVPAIGMMLVVGGLSFWVSPWGAQNVENILNRQDAMTEFDNIIPGRFQALKGSSRATYAEQLSADRETMYGVFIANRDAKKSTTEPAMTLVMARTGAIEQQDDSGRYLILNDGYRYDGTAGSADFRATQFDRYGVLMDQNEVKKEATKEKGFPTSRLLGSDDPRLQAELQWRISIPLLIPIVVLLAVPLSRVNPRQGRYAKLLPAILLYLFYLSLLIAVKGAVEDGKIPAEIGVWPVHIVFLIISVVIYFYAPLQHWWHLRHRVTG
ncbi:LPS export ABC transporter permease LptF [Endozoicomonadaceae bacterium StTr2]